MSSSPQNSAGRPASQESSGGGRHLYLIEIVLGAVLLLVVVLIYLSNKPRSRDDDDNTDNSHGNVVKLTAANWRKEVIDSPIPVLVDFWAPWCGPCLKLAPTIDRLADRYAGKIKVGKVNVDNAKQLAVRYGVRPIPAVFIFHGGEEPRRSFVGLMSEAELAAEIDAVLNGEPDDAPP